MVTVILYDQNGLLSVILSEAKDLYIDIIF